MLNSNISGEMAQLMISNQTKYVPSVKNHDAVKVLQPVYLDGDALTEERARNIQWVFKDGDDHFDRLEGLKPVHTDWHAKVKIYEVIFSGYLKSSEDYFNQLNSKTSLIWNFSKSTFAHAGSF